MTWAIAQDATRFFLEVAEDNAPALKLYRSHGLVPVGRRPDYYENADGRRTTALTMRCDFPRAGPEPYPVSCTLSDRAGSGAGTAKRRQA